MSELIVKYTVGEKTLRRLTLCGPEADARRVMLALHEAGYRVVRSGPYLTRETFPHVDDTRFLIEAEKEEACGS